MNVIIMAGGAGTRFWPVSRARYPKQFLKITGSRPLIEETFLRIAAITEEEKVYIIVHEDHKELTQKIFMGKKVKILSEPLARNTAACIGLGLIHILKEQGDGPVVVLPADQYIGNVEVFQETIVRAAKLVEKGGIATIGIVPTRPETGYGYIKGGESLSGELETYRVNSFVEKPSLELAIQFLSEGTYYWNAGIFVFKAQTMMDEIKRSLPELHEGLIHLYSSFDKQDFNQELKKMYQEIAPVSIDYGVMEKAFSDIFVIPGHFPWSDVGSWQAIFELRNDDRDENGNLVEGNAMVLDCSNTLVHSRSNRLIGCLGLKDIVVVDTDDVLLVSDMKASQDVRRFIPLVKDKGLEDLV